MKGLKNARLRSGFTQEEVAKFLAVTNITISRWETGRVQPSIETLKRLSNLYECSIDELVTNDEPNPTAPRQEDDD